MSLKLQPIFHLGSPRKTDPTKCQVSFGKLRKKLFLGGLGGVRFPGPSKVANCQSVEDCKKYVIFRDIDGAQLPLIRQNQAANAHIDGATPSYLPTSINQPNQNMPHRSELSQGRRQNHQERHQSSFLGHRWRNCLLSWDNSDRCGTFWLGWLMDVGRYEGVAPSMWHSQPDFGERVGVAPSMSQKGSLMLRKNMGRNQRRRLQKICHF